MKTNKNIAVGLITRERGVKCNVRHNVKMMSHLVTSEDTHFVKIWERHATKLIHYDCGRLYFDNYRDCYTIYGHSGQPSLLYKLPSSPVSEKIEEGVICQGPLDLTDIPAAHQSHKPSFLALTANNWLIRYHIDTGEILQKVYLSFRHKFRHLAWDCEEHTVVLKSTHNTMSTLAREAAITQTLLMALAVFTVFPLEFVAVLEVTKNIFGHDITDSMLSQGIVIVMHQSSFVKFYSFEHILQEGRTHSPHLYDVVGSEEVIGSEPYGLPVNIKLKECPPVLFQVKCSEHSLCLGGIPWHYIITPPGSRGYFKTYSLEDGQLAEDGCLDLDSVNIEPDKCLFHPDDSGRILHIGSQEIHVYKLVEKDHYVNGLPRYKVQEVYNIQPFVALHKGPNLPHYSSSGRVIKKSYAEDSVDSSYEYIPTVDYENDLDLLYLSIVSQSGDDVKSVVHLYDNQTGTLVKQIPLEKRWKEFYDHVISLDLDVLIHIVKSPMRKFSCFVYKLHRKGIEAEGLTKNKTETKPSGAGKKISQQAGEGVRRSRCRLTTGRKTNRRRMKRESDDWT